MAVPSDLGERAEVLVEKHAEYIVGFSKVCLHEGPSERGAVSVTIHLCPCIRCALAHLLHTLMYAKYQHSSAFIISQHC